MKIQIFIDKVPKTIEFNDEHLINLSSFLARVNELENLDLDKFTFTFKTRKRKGESSMTSSISTYPSTTKSAPASFKKQTRSKPVSAELSLQIKNYINGKLQNQYPDMLQSQKGSFLKMVADVTNGFVQNLSREEVINYNEEKINNFLDFYLKNSNVTSSKTSSNQIDSKWVTFQEEETLSRVSSLLQVV